MDKSCNLVYSPYRFSYNFLLDFFDKEVWGSLIRFRSLKIMVPGYFGEHNKLCEP